MGFIHSFIHQKCIAYLSFVKHGPRLKLNDENSWSLPLDGLQFDGGQTSEEKNPNTCSHGGVERAGRVHWESEAAQRGGIEAETFSVNQDGGRPFQRQDCRFMGSWEQIQSGKIEVVSTFQCKCQLSKNNYCLNSLPHPFVRLH